MINKERCQRIVSLEKVDVVSSHTYSERLHDDRTVIVHVGDKYEVGMMYYGGTTVYDAVSCDNFEQAQAVFTAKLLRQIRIHQLDNLDLLDAFALIFKFILKAQVTIPGFILTKKV